MPTADDTPAPPFGNGSMVNTKQGYVPDARLDRPPVRDPIKSTWEGRPGPAYVPRQPR